MTARELANTKGFQICGNLHRKADDTYYSPDGEKVTDRQYYDDAGNLIAVRIGSDSGYIVTADGGVL